MRGRFELTMRNGAGDLWFQERRSGIKVISSLTDAVYPDGSGDVGPQWHVSASIDPGDGRRRPTNDEMQVVLDAWQLDE